MNESKILIFAYNSDRVVYSRVPLKKYIKANVLYSLEADKGFL